jgi:hypothetical protein
VFCCDLSALRFCGIRMSNYELIDNLFIKLRSLDGMRSLLDLLPRPTIEKDLA